MNQSSCNDRPAVSFVTLGCRLNEAESEVWSRQFRELGYAITLNPRSGDLVVINSCAVTGEAARKSRRLIRKIEQGSPGVRFIVTGCMATLEENRVSGMDGVELIVSNTEKDRLVSLVDAKFPDAGVGRSDSDRMMAQRQRAFLKVQDGCRYRCSYCIVTLARGEERSRTIQNVIDDINRARRGGFNEAVLAGVHLGGYGADLGLRLFDLIHEVLAQTDIPRLRLGSLEPWELDEDFWCLFENPRLLPHLHLPIQSGSDSVLRRMSRRGRSDDYQALIEQGRSRVPGLNITTDIIVGFPGETEAEWLETRDFVAEMAFGDLHVFPFSPREGTKAASLPDPVPDAIKRERAQALRELGARMRLQQLSTQVGRCCEILVEGNPEPDLNGGLLYSGYSPEYRRVAVPLPKDADPVGQIMPVEIVAVEESGERLLAKSI